MNKKRVIFIIYLVLFCFWKLEAQQDVSQFLEQRYKYIEDSELSDEAKEEWLERLHSFALSPLNLNNATESANIAAASDHRYTLRCSSSKKSQSRFLHAYIVTSIMLPIMDSSYGLQTLM